ncbi:Acyl-coenzyme A dehydrogenase FadE [hydrothermal vent metagenome]|uniref:Acyl-coenzyme A dehydrogenase n=1 Tax=hydrothermal vent metagenome TaxID=652676 RepID=A0A3B0ZBL2_9ZZZZ
MKTSSATDSNSNPRDSWRIKWISLPVFKLFKRITPPMSDTEKDAIDAGTVWWDGELFSGKPNWKKIRRSKPGHLSEEEQAFIDGPVDTLCEMLNDWELNQRDYDLPEDVWRYIKDEGFLSLIIPKQYGGKDFSALAHSEIVMKVSTRSVAAAVTVMVPNSLGPGKLILEYGTEEQKNYYLPRLAKGVDVPCFALTSPDAGSDAGAIPDFGIVCKQDYDGEKDVLGVRVTWEKRYITLGPIATLLGLAFKLYDPGHLIGDKESLGITCALIPTDTPGVNIGRRHLPLNVMFMNGPNSGKDVFIPMNWLIGGVERAGQGWRMLMECLADGRSISLPALSTGAGKLASRSVGGYSRIRRQFKLPIGRFEGVQEALARIAGSTYKMDAARTLTATALDKGEKPSVISAIVKYNLTESMRKTINDAMDILGGAGICLGPQNIMGRAYQAIPISITVEGANILTRSMIVFGQGAVRSHPYIFQEMEAISTDDPNESIEKFDRALFGHIRYFISNAYRSFYHALTSSFFVFVGAIGKTRRYYQHTTRLSAAFALLADTSIMMFGSSLKRKEKISGRLADILSQLYLITAVMKRFEDQGSHKEDIPLLKWVCDDTLFTIQEKMDGLLSNLPIRPAAWIIRLLIFPLGRQFSKPSDKLGTTIAEILLSPSDCRNRLTKGMFIPSDTNQQVARIDDALIKIIKAQHIEKKVYRELRDNDASFNDMNSMINTAVEKNIITQEESSLLLAAEKARSDVIRVDDFPGDFKI